MVAIFGPGLLANAVAETGGGPARNIIAKTQALSMVPHPADLSVPGAPVIANFPLVTCGFAIGNGSSRRTQEPFNHNFAAKNWAVHQMLAFNTEGQRQTKHAEFSAFHALNTKIHHVPHIDIHGIHIDDKPNSALGAPFEDLLYNDPTGEGFDAYVFDGGGNYWRRNQAYTLRYNWQALPIVHSAVAAMIFDIWSDFNNEIDPGINSAKDFRLSIMQDTLRVFNQNGLSVPNRYQNEISSVINQNEFQIPTWSDASSYFSGTPDADGYTPSSERMDASVLKGNRTNGTSDDIIGHQVINGTTDQIKFSGSPRFTINAGDTVVAFEYDNGGRTSGQGNDSDWHAGVISFLDSYAGIQEANYGFKVGIYCNMASGNTLAKNGSETAVRALIPYGITDWVSAYDGIHFEWFDEKMGFCSHVDETGYYTTGHGRNANNYNASNLEKLALYIGVNRPFLKGSADSHNHYPCLWLNQARVREQTGSDTADYAAMTDLDAAYVRFYSLLSWCMDNCAPQPEMGSHDKPVMISEELINLGNPITARDFWTNYDPDGNDWKGSASWKTADFGTYGYLFEFDNGLIQLNARPPSVPGLWTPSWMTGGQSISAAVDRATLPSAGAGNKWQAFNEATYVNDNDNSQHFNKSVSDYSAGYILTDPVLNDGSDRSSTYDTGALEGVIHMRVPV